VSRVSNTSENASTPKIGGESAGKDMYMPDIRIHTKSGPFKPMLAKVYTPGSTALKWPVAVQPKYDGVRALWDGEQVRSRSGKDTLVVPREIMDVLEQNFKGIPLDGEFYIHDVGFETVVSTVRGGGAGADALQYVVFDMPTSEGFEDRVRHLGEMLEEGGTWKYPQVVMAPYAQIQTPTQLASWMEMWTLQGYEGIMIRTLGVGYEERRTSQLLKWKRTLTARAYVTGIEPGKGKHENRMGALRVKGVNVPWTCKIGTGFSDAERERGAGEWLGKTVTVAFQEFSVYGVPRFPRYVRLASEGEV
jgi:DNA ligase-1